MNSVVFSTTVLVAATERDQSISLASPTVPAASKVSGFKVRLLALQASDALATNRPLMLATMCLRQSGPDTN